MIRPEELKIGNYVDVCTYVKSVIVPTGLYKRVSAIPRNGVDLTLPSDREDFILAYQMIEPIPLTEEMFLKCGFIEVPYYENILQKENIRIHFDKQKSSEVLFVLYDDDGDITCQTRVSCLHQLQNLYFALTGKELDLTNINQLKNEHELDYR